MKNQVLFTLFVLYSYLYVSAQYPTNWNSFGKQIINTNPSPIISILSFGGKADNSTDNSSALQTAIKSANGKPITIEFPAGNYLFKKPVSLPSDVIIRGAGSDKTTLNFQLNGNSDAISIQGKQEKLSTNIISGTTKDSKTITVANSTGFSIGDFALIKQTANHLLASNWAYNTFFQLVEITAVSGNNITFKHPLRLDFPISNQPQLIKIEPVKNVGIESLKIKRLDATSGQTSTLFFNYVVNSHIKAVEIENANYAHITLQSSSFNTVSGNYLHDAFDYGSGGKGYGIVLQFGAGDNFIYDNIFKKLRHAILLQATANGNAIAYNYSYEPYWTQGFLPSNSAGDIVLHGNYPYSNLFEGNIIQNLVIDNSHGINGPYNTFFRNRIENYGVVMNSGSGDNMFFLANEITGNGIMKGLFTTIGNHTSIANNIKGRLQNGTIKETSLIHSNYSSKIGSPYSLNSWNNEAYKRNNNAVKTYYHVEKNVSVINNTPTNSNTANTTPPKKVKKKCGKKKK